MFTDPWNTVSHAFLCLFNTTRDRRRSLENKIGNPTFVDEETIGMLHQDKDYYDDYKTPDTSRVEETTVPDATEVTSNIKAKTKVR